MYAKRTYFYFSSYENGVPKTIVDLTEILNAFLAL